MRSLDNCHVEKLGKFALSVDYILTKMDEFLEVPSDTHLKSN